MSGKYYLDETGTYYNDKKSGTWYEYFSDGDIRSKITYENGTKKKEVYATSLYMHNKTSYEVQVLLRYKNLKNEWITEGWFRIKPGKKEKVRTLLDAKFLYYASSLDYKSEWTGKESRSYEGKYYKMREKNISESIMSGDDKDYTLSLTD